MSSLEHLALSIITLFAASVNGALGDGFSSLTVPPALLFLTNRTQPALVLIEVVLKRLRALRQPQEPVAGVATEGTADRRPRPRRLRRHPARGSTGSIVDEAVDVRLPASTDSVSGRWVWSPALVGPAIRSGIRRRLGCALFGDHDLGSTARPTAQQRKLREERVSCSARPGQARGVLHDGGRILAAKQQGMSPGRGRARGVSSEPASHTT